MSNPHKFASATHVTGTVGAVAISFDAVAADFQSSRYVTLTASYARSPMPGYPRIDAGAPVAASLVAYPQTILSGARVLLFQPEAAALVSAGAASYS
jgi:hypothetical protein